MKTTDLPTIPFPFPSIQALLTHHAEKYGAHDAIIAVNADTDETHTLSYSDLRVLVRRTVEFLEESQIRKNDCFAILMQNTAEILLFELAGACLGAATVPLDIKRDTYERKRYKLKDTQAKTLFVKKDGMQDQELDTLIKDIPSLTIRAWSSYDEFLDLLPQTPVKLKTDATLSSRYIILYTSGTTALPKGVPLTIHSCLLNAMGIIDWQKLNDQDRFNIVLPLHHINSTQFCLATLISGGTIILNTRYSASNFWNVISTYRATNTSIVPTILHDLLVRHDEYKKNGFDVSALKRICIGSAPVLPEETYQFYDAFGIRVVQGYGQTETALRVAGVPIATDEDTYRRLVKNNTIGSELANNHLAIMDDTNTELEEGKEGEICISGPILADGYLNNPEETAKAFKEGWFHSGDLGYWKYENERKFYFIIGRIKEIIIKGGVNLSPSAIEDALLRAFPEIDEVSVVGYPDERMGEEVCAVIVPKDPNTQFLAQKILSSTSIPGISPYEYPKQVFIRDALPKTSTGKIQRVEVKKYVRDVSPETPQKHYYVRIIHRDESELLRTALRINNSRWTGLPATREEFIARAQNALLLGVFEEQAGLVGTLSCVRLEHGVVATLKTWDQATSHGTLENNNPNGDTLVCVAISVKSKSNNGTIQQLNNSDEARLRPMARKKIQEYLALGRDHVIEFHKKSKGGLPGAVVWKILENGRPEDRESLGYNILMKYPSLDTIEKITFTPPQAGGTPSILLIEHALSYAKKEGIKEVIAFSRPAGLRNYLAQLILPIH
ncbi:MAG: class I adenylate-forming enzyme family protein [bacterium]|nr:class I adenylate-forming enzyme family protein [bacterium]